MNWKAKAIIKKLLKKIGYEIHKIPKARGEGKYTLCLPYYYSTYSPWFEDWFQDIYDKVKDYTMVTEDRCYIIHKFCLHCLNLEGDFAECGVYKGGTAFMTAYTLRSNSVLDKQVHLFDTFVGMPSFAELGIDGHKEGDFGDVSLNEVKQFLSEFPFVFFHPGVLPDTLSDVRDSRFAYVHVDVDLYDTTMELCNFFYDRMVRGGIMIFDDYGFPGYELAERKAVDEFFSDKPESPISLRTGQCFVYKL